jgi:hypothetical protein
MRKTRELSGAIDFRALNIAKDGTLIRKIW